MYNMHLLNHVVKYLNDKDANLSEDTLSHHTKMKQLDSLTYVDGRFVGTFTPEPQQEELSQDQIKEELKALSLQYEGKLEEYDTLAAEVDELRDQYDIRRSILVDNNLAEETEFILSDDENDDVDEDEEE